MLVNSEQDIFTERNIFHVDMPSCKNTYFYLRFLIRYHAVPVSILHMLTRRQGKEFLFITVSQLFG
uniref:Uncharacterized protein n=1 Tax=Anguilla anguilla TaxID=7936 RepID=A0A0E9PSE0_ANGAN